MRVREAELAHHDVERDHDHDRREHVGEQHGRRDRLAAAEAEARDAVGREHGDGDRQQRRAAGDEDRVDEVGLELRLVEEPAIGVEVRRARPEARRRGDDLAVGLDRLVGGIPVL